MFVYILTAVCLQNTTYLASSNLFDSTSQYGDSGKNHMKNVNITGATIAK